MIESVRGQREEGWELWIMDGGSTDETAAVIGEYRHDTRIHWHSEPDRGQSHAINKGLARTSGEIFNWINTDDCLDAEAFVRLKQHFADPRVEVVCGRCRVFRQADGKTITHYQMPQFRSVYKTVLSDFCAQPSTFWRREVVVELGGVKEDLRCVMDWHLWLRYLVYRGQRAIRWVPEVLAHFRIHDESKTSSIRERFLQEIGWVHWDLFRQAGAPEQIVQYLKRDVRLELEPTRWRWGKDFKPERLFLEYCLRQAHRMRKDAKRRDEVRWLLDEARKLGGRRSLLWWQTAWRVKA
jgi:glycosyltransferase involved in cell wall biosynthesis